MKSTRVNKTLKNIKEQSKKDLKDIRKLKELNSKGFGVIQKKLKSSTILIKKIIQKRKKYLEKLHNIKLDSHLEIIKDALDELKLKDHNDTNVLQEMALLLKEDDFLETYPNVKEILSELNSRYNDKRHISIVIQQIQASLLTLQAKLKNKKQLIESLTKNINEKNEQINKLFQELKSKYDNYCNKEVRNEIRNKLSEIESFIKFSSFESSGFDFNIDYSDIYDETEFNDFDSDSDDNLFGNDYNFNFDSDDDYDSDDDIFGFNFNDDLFSKRRRRRRSRSNLFGRRSRSRSRSSKNVLDLS